MKWFRSNWISKLFDNEVFIRVLSIVIAVVGWFLVALIVKPDSIGNISNVPVTIEMDNTDAQMLGLEVVEGGDQKITVTVNGKRYRVGSLTADNFEAVARPDKVTSPGTYELDVVIKKRTTITDSGSDYEIESTNPAKITVKFDRIVSREFSASESNLEVLADGITPAEEFIKGTPTISPDTITVTGPEGDMERIAKCVVRTDAVEERSETYTTNGTVEFYDTDGQIIDFSNNPNVKLSSDKYTIAVPILKQKTLPLTFDYINVPDGFDVSTLKYTMDNPFLEIAAPASVIDNISSLRIGYVDFRKLSLSASFDFNINLRSSMKNINNVESVNVTFDMSAYTSKTVRIPYANLRIINKPESVDARVTTQYISVKLIGTPEDLAAVTANDVIGEIDMIDQKVTDASSVTFPVTVTIPSKTSVWAVDEYSAIVRVTPQ
ncbi:MAG: YbbR-like domain-containing protein [Oscillospiraceae bacterium]